MSISPVITTSALVDALLFATKTGDVETILEEAQRVGINGERLLGDRESNAASFVGRESGRDAGDGESGEEDAAHGETPEISRQN